MFDVKIVLSIKEQMLTAIATLRAHASEPYLLEKAIHNLNSASSEENSIIQSGIYLQQKGPPHTPPLIFFPFIQLYLFCNIFLFYYPLRCSEHFLFMHLVLETTNKR